MAVLTLVLVVLLILSYVIPFDKIIHKKSDTYKGAFPYSYKKDDEWKEGD